MLYSMTGYGKSRAIVDGVIYTIEARSLNSKYLDLNLKIPQELKHKEIEIRNLVSQKLLRGKIELTIGLDASGQESNAQFINKELFGAYYKEAKELVDEFDLDSDSLLGALLRIPDIFQTEVGQLDDDSWKTLEESIDHTLAALKNFRLNEGEELEKDLKDRIGIIQEHTAIVETLEKGRVPKIRERIEKNMADLINNDQFDRNRLEQEMIFYIEKLDITEEIVRLNSHCEYFNNTMAASDEEKGKKLNFISQEIGREINTIGSKSNDAGMQKEVVIMKEQLEKIKEQLNNIL